MQSTNLFNPPPRRWFSAARIGAAGVAFILAGCASRQPDVTGPEAAIRALTGHPLAGPDQAETLAPGVTFLDGLTEEESVAMALWSQPNFRAALAGLGISRARMIEAGQLVNPSLSMLFPVGPKQLEFAVNLPVQALWLRPRRVAIADFDYRQLARRLVQNGLDTRRDVRVGFVDAWRMAELRRFLDSRARVRNEIAELQMERLKIGALSEREATQARIDSATAAQAATRAAHEVVAADQRLRLLVALEFWKEPIDWRYQAPDLIGSLPEETLIRGALAARPDLRAAELMIEGNGLRAGLARSEIYSAIAVIDANGTGGDFEIGPGLNLALPIFNRNEGRIEGAKALLRKSVLDYAAMKNRVVGEVQQALRNLAREQDELRDSLNRILPAAEELLTQTRAARDAGGLSDLEVLQAELQVIDVRRAAMEPAARYHIALAELERSVGLRLQDIQSLTQEKLP